MKIEQQGCGERSRKVKLLDYKKRWNYLQKEENPFAIVVMAHLKALETKKDNALRKQWKTELTKFLLDRLLQNENFFQVQGGKQI